MREAKFHCLLFLNIPRYAGGTQPWGSHRSSGEDEPSSSRLQPPGGAPSVAPSLVDFSPPSINDGRMEVLGFTSASLAAIQIGGHGERLAQCRSVKMVTWKPIPAQVDGEPCRLAPSHITIRFHSKVPMLRRVRSGREPSPGQSPQSSSPSRPLRSSMKTASRSPSAATVRMDSILLRLPVAVVSFRDYELNKEDVEQLKLKAWEVGLVSVNAEAELGSIRDEVSTALRKGRKPASAPHYRPASDWHYVDYKSCGNLAFRVPLVEEGVHSVSDVANPDEVLLVLDDAFPALPPADVGEESGGSNWARRRSSRKRRKKFSQPFKMVLHGEKGETAL